MNSTFRLFTFAVIALFSFMVSCDSLPGTSTLPAKTITLKNFRIVPDTVSFRNASSLKDTNITIQVFVNTDESSDLKENPIVHFYEKNADLLVNVDTLVLSDAATNEYNASLSFTISTGSSTIAELVVTAIANSGEVTNYLRKDLHIIGFAIQPPVIEEVFSPDTVFIPTSGIQNFLLSARITHPDNATFISRAFVDIVDQNQNNIGSFRLFDDGSAAPVENGVTSGDLAASDSVFSRGFALNSTNLPDVLQLTFYAIDVSSQESNRITKTLVFAR